MQDADGRSQYRAVGLAVLCSWAIATAGAAAAKAPPSDARHAQPAPAGAVAMFRGGPALAGVYPAPSPYQLQGVRFSFDAGAPIRSTPAVDAGTIYFGSADGSVFALDARTGAQRWRARTGGGVNASPAVVGGLLYVTSRDNSLYALSTADGAVKWRFDLGKDLGSKNYWDFYTSSPTPFGDALYVGSGDGHVFALDRRSGRRIWSFDAGSRVRSTPAVTADAVVFGTMDGHVVALDRRTGAERWRFATEGASHTFELKQNDTTSVFASPTIADGVVAIGGRDGFAYGIDLATGAQKWKITHDGSSWILSTAATGGQLIIGSGSAAILQAVDLKTGAELWRFKTTSAIFGSPTIAGEVVLVDDFAGNLYAVDRSTGVEAWRFPLGDRAFSTPVVAGDTVYASSDEGRLYALAVSAARKPAAKPLRRLVYWEPKQADDAFNWFQNDIDVAIRGSFEGSAYERVDGPALAEAMADQIAGKSRAVVVFAADRMPNAVLDRPDDRALVRRFLDAGGRVVFLGSNPVGFKYDPKSGALVDIDRSLLAPVLGLDFPPLENERGYHVSQATAAGEAWGLHGLFVSNGAIAPAQVTTVLASNEFGLATAWVKTYGRNGGELIQLAVPTYFTGSLTPYHIAAEHGLP